MRPRAITLGSALVGVAALVVFREVNEPESEAQQLPRMVGPSLVDRTTPNWRLVQYGHDWIEPLPENKPSLVDEREGLARALLQPGPIPSRIRADLLNGECRNPGCRTCQWMKIFGGEW